MENAKLNTINIKSEAKERGIIIITDDILIDWVSLKEKLMKFYKLDRKLAEMLEDKVLESIKSGDEERAQREFKKIIRRDFKEEMSLHINRGMVDILERALEYRDVILITNLSSYKYIFLPILHIFTKVFFPHSYNKKIDDSKFISVIYGYIKYYSNSLPSLTLFTSNYSFMKKFSEKFKRERKLVFLYYDIYNKYGKTESEIKNIIPISYITRMKSRDSSHFLRVLLGRNDE